MFEIFSTSKYVSSEYFSYVEKCHAFVSLEFHARFRIKYWIHDTCAICTFKECMDRFIQTEIFEPSPWRVMHPLVICDIANWRDPPLIGKSTISMCHFPKLC